MSDEKLIPVRDVAELKVGMILVARHTVESSCGRGEHRFMLTSIGESFTRRTVYGEPCTTSCTVLPRPACLSRGGNGIALDVNVRKGTLFRVDDGLTDGELESWASLETQARLYRAFCGAAGLSESAKGGVR